MLLWIKETPKNKEDLCDYLKLYFYYIKKEQKLVVMYLELILTGKKAESWEVAVVRIEAGKKDCLSRNWDQ